MASYPENVYTVDVIGEFVDRIRAVEPITNITNLSGNTWLIETSLTHALRNGQYVVIDSTAYAVSNVIQNVSFEITSTTPVVSSQWKAEAPYYYHGTPITICEDLRRKPDAQKFPLVCLFEIFDDHKNRMVNSNLIKKPDCRLFFMDDAQAQDSNEQHHVNKVQPMEDLEELFIDELETHAFIGKLETEFSSVPRANWGVWIQNQGNIKQILDWKLSGVELRLRIPIQVGFGGCTDTRPIACPSYCELTDSLDPTVSGACINASPNLAGIQAEICTGGGGGSVNVNQSDSTLIANVLGDFPATEFNVADSNVQSSGGTYDVDVKATDSLVVPDVTLTLNTAAFTDIESATTEDLQLVNQFDVDIVPDSIVDTKITVTVPSPSGIVYQRPIYGGQTTQYAVNDAKSHLDQGSYDYTRVPFPVSYAQQDNADASPFLTLLNNNTFGDKFRFFDEDGLQVFGSGVGTDGITGLMWQLVPDSPNSWVSALTNTASSTLADFSDWRLPTINELLSLADYSIGSGGLDYFPFDQTLAGDDLWSNETFPNDTLRADVLFFNLDAVDITININRALKTGLVRYMMVRTELSS